MVRLLQAGLLAGQHQIAMVVVITMASLIATHILTFNEGSAELIDVSAFWGQASTFLTWAYLLAAVGLALTSGDHVDETAESMEQAARSGRLGRPEFALKFLVAQSALCSATFAFLIFCGEPSPLVDAARYFGFMSAAPVIWTALMSVGLASFGATCQAACKALGRFQN